MPRCRRASFTCAAATDITTDVQLTVDGVAYGLSPFGGLIRYWNSLLPELAQSGVHVVLQLPAQTKSTAPHIASRVDDLPEVFTSTYYAASAAAPSVVVVHDLIYEQDPTVRDLADRRQTLEAKAAAIEQAAVIVVPSHSTASDLGRQYNVDVPVRVIHHGVAGLFRPWDARRNDPASDVILATQRIDRPFVLHVGGRARYKRFSDVLEAFVRNRTLRDNYQLVVVGSERYLLEEELELATQLPGDTVRLLGYQSDVALASLYHHCDAVVSASASEGFNLSILEAAACAAPVACTSIPPHMEHAGRFGETFEVGDIDGLVTALLTACCMDQSARLSMSQEIRLRHSWERASEQFANAVRDSLTMR